jgi:hypothetical protein
VGSGRSCQPLRFTEIVAAIGTLIKADCLANFVTVNTLYVMLNEKTPGRVRLIFSGFHRGRECAYILGLTLTWILSTKTNDGI